MYQCFTFYSPLKFNLVPFSDLRSVNSIQKTIPIMSQAASWAKDDKGYLKYLSGAVSNLKLLT